MYLKATSIIHKILVYNNNNLSINIYTCRNYKNNLVDTTCKTYLFIVKFTV